RAAVFDAGANAVHVRLAYPASKLTYVGSAVDTDVWTVTASQSARGGHLDIAVAGKAPVTDDQLVATATFTVEARGPIELRIGETSYVASAATGADLLAHADAATAPRTHRPSTSHRSRR